MELWLRLAAAQRVVRTRSKERGISIKEGWNSPDIVDEAVFVGRDKGKPCFEQICGINLAKGTDVKNPIITICWE